MKLRESSSDIRKWFKVFDTDKNNKLSQDELANVIKQAGARVPERELSQLFKLLDKSGDGYLQANEFCDVMEDKTVPDYEGFVKKEREKFKNKEDIDLIEQAKAANVKSMGAETGTEAVDKDKKLGRIEGLSSIMGDSQF